MSQVECQHLDDSGICQGKYSGFGCIEDKCQDPTKGPKSDTVEDESYCKKHGKFNCPGDDCIDFEN